MGDSADVCASLVRLRVGKHHFPTRRATLERLPLLQRLLASHESKKEIFIDRDGALFRQLLNYVTTGKVQLSPEQDSKRRLLEEARYYGLDDLVALLNQGSSNVPPVEGQRNCPCGFALPDLEDTTGVALSRCLFESSLSGTPTRCLCRDLLATLPTARTKSSATDSHSGCGSRKSSDARSISPSGVTSRVSISAPRSASSSLASPPVGRSPSASISVSSETTTTPLSCGPACACAAAITTSTTSVTVPLLLNAFSSPAVSSRVMSVSGTSPHGSTTMISTTTTVATTTSYVITSPLPSIPVSSSSSSFSSSSPSSSPACPARSLSLRTSHSSMESLGVPASCASSASPLRSVSSTAETYADDTDAEERFPCSSPTYAVPPVSLDAAASSSSVFKASCSETELQVRDSTQRREGCPSVDKLSTATSASHFDKPATSMDTSQGETIELVETMDADDGQQQTKEAVPTLSRQQLQTLKALERLERMEREAEESGKPRPAQGKMRVTACGKQYEEFAWSEVVLHKYAHDCWLVAYGKVYDVTKFLSEHPGGKLSILKHAGKDATRDFDFHSWKAQRMWEKYQIGWIEGKAPSACLIM